MTTRFPVSSVIDKMRIELLREEHVAGVADIERRCFSEPWSENSVRMLMGDNAFGLVAVEDGSVAAYGGMVCVLDEGQITNVATLPEFRRRGLARAVLERMVGEAGARGITFITLEVRESNASAISLYEDLGFFAVGKRNNFYRKPTEAAIIMEKKL